MLKKTSVDSFEIINEWENDEEIIFYSEESDYEPQAPEETKGMLNNLIQKEDMVHLTIFSRVSNQPIGYCLLACIDKFHHKAKIGITIGSKSEWGKSYGEEALTGLLHYAFDELELNRITAEVFAFNKRAIKLFEKLGFKQEGKIRENVYKNGNYHDELIFGLLKKEWAQSS